MIKIVIGSILFLAGTRVFLYSQPPRGGGPFGGQPNVSEPIVGIMSLKGAVANLFPIKSTGVRTPNGNDYGNDILRQHYRQHAH